MSWWLAITIYRYYNDVMTRHDHPNWNPFDEFHGAGRGGGRRRGGRGGRGEGRGPIIPPAPGIPGVPPGPGWGGHGGGWGGGPPGRMDFRSMFGHPGRRGRGDVRAAVLLILSEQPCNGYQLMQEIERRSGGDWRPSSGSIYPQLQQLEDEGLVLVEPVPTGKQFKLTDRGSKYVTANRTKLGTPWEAQSAEPRQNVMALLGQIGPALAQVARFGTAEQVAEAERIVTEARRALYRILAEEPAEDE